MCDKAGESFIIPKGYDCQWHQTGYWRKFSVISEQPEEEELPAAPAHAPFYVTPSAAPQQHISYLDTTGKFISGTWARDPFESEQCPFPYNELPTCKIIQSL